MCHVIKVINVCATSKFSYVARNFVEVFKGSLKVFDFVFMHFIQ